MKQLLFLFLFPCLAMAQYTGNAGQKITLGEQTTADGLVWRGRLADTANLLTNKLDTSVYIVLDTGTRAMWYYRASTTPKWTRLVDSLNNLQGQLSLTSKVTGTLPVANGGTNASTFTAGSVVFAGANGTSLAQDNANLFWDDTNNRLGIGRTSLNDALDVNGNILSRRTGTNATEVKCENDSVKIRFLASVNTAFLTVSTNFPLVIETNNQPRMRITAAGNVGIGTASPAVQFHTTGGVRFAGLASITDLRTDADGDLFNGSDFNLKNSIDTINFGLSDVLKLKPVIFNWNDEARNINEYKSMGFIAQDVMDVIPNAASTMGDGDMQVDYNAIVATLTKAIQEQQALIKALEQRILNLENK